MRGAETTSKTERAAIARRNMIPNQFATVVKHKLTVMRKFLTFARYSILFLCFGDDTQFYPCFVLVKGIIILGRSVPINRREPESAWME